MKPVTEAPDILPMADDTVDMTTTRPRFTEISLSEGLNTRSQAIAVGLRDSLEPIVRKVVGIGGRPAALSRGLEIDRTLAARVLRAIRATDT